MFLKYLTGGISSTLLLDGHTSCLQLPLLQYISDPAHLWVILIGVPYGTRIWQVRNSNEQNGPYKMALDWIKKALITFKERRMMSRLTIEVHGIINLINFAWEQSFTQVK